MTNFKALARARALELLRDERRSISSTEVGVFARSGFVPIAAGRIILGVYTCVHSVLGSPCWKILLPLTQGLPAQRRKGQADEGVSDNRAASE